MIGENTVRVFYSNVQDRWYVKEGVQETPSLPNKKAAAVETGKEIVKSNKPSKLIIEQRNGTVDETINYK